MWENKTGKEPIIIDSKDWTEDEFALFCGLFGIDPSGTEMFVLRENYVTETLLRDSTECSSFKNTPAA